MYLNPVGTVNAVKGVSGLVTLGVDGPPVGATGACTVGSTGLPSSSAII